ncbi:hypothetical protein MMMB2_0487 [Mycobacterium marinum MB2]|nr:hypothetical protein MMMB2_0487 [Mycobacterium marinum MB2]
MVADSRIWIAGGLARELAHLTGLLGGRFRTGSNDPDKT